MLRFVKKYLFFAHTLFQFVNFFYTYLVPICQKKKIFAHTPCYDLSKLSIFCRNLITIGQKIFSTHNLFRFVKNYLFFAHTLFRYAKKKIIFVYPLFRFVKNYLFFAHALLRFIKNYFC